MYLFLAGNHHLAELLAGELKRGTDEVMLTSYHVAAFFHFEDTYIKHKYGLMGPHAIGFLKESIRSTMQAPSALTVWESHKERFNDEFTDFLDLTLAETTS
jgi:hypothetical protein